MAEKDMVTGIAEEVEAMAVSETAGRANLPAAAKRALAEAAARRRQAAAPAAKSSAEAGAEQTIREKAETGKAGIAPAQPTQPKEFGGRREGRDPTRYGDWEFKGRAIDF